MSISLATGGVISGGLGGAGEPVYVDVPICDPDGTTESVGELFTSAFDPDAVPPQPEAGEELLPRKLSTVQILPTKTLDNFAPPGNL